MTLQPLPVVHSPKHLGMTCVLCRSKASGAIPDEISATHIYAEKLESRKFAKVTYSLSILRADIWTLKFRQVLTVISVLLSACGETYEIHRKGQKNRMLSNLFIAQVTLLPQKEQKYIFTCIWASKKLSA